MFRFIAFFSLIWFALLPLAQAENQVWTSTGLKKPLSPTGPYAVSLDIASRHHPDGGVERIELRPGLAYRLQNGVTVSGGYHWVHANREGPDRNEHRLWQQVGYGLPGAGKLAISGRTRIEQRYREHSQDTGIRLRQRLLLSYPIARTELSVIAGPELFVEFVDTDWGARSGLREIRTQLALEWTVSDMLELSLGYLNQAELDPSAPDSMDHHILIGLSRQF